MTTTLTLTFVPGDAVASLAEPDVLRSYLYELEGAPKKRTFVLHRTQDDLFAVMRAGGLGDAAFEFEREHTRLADSDLVVRLMAAGDVAFVRDWLEPREHVLPIPIDGTVSDASGEPIDGDWLAALIEELQRLSTWFRDAYRDADALLLITDG